MEPTKKTTFMTYLPAVLILSVVGWIGIVVVILETLPTLGPRWLFFFLTVVALSGTALPLVYFLNLRFPTRPPADGGIIVREAGWFGVYGSALAWLQLGRVLSPVMAIVLAVVLIIIEVLLRLRERSHWEPTE